MRKLALGFGGLLVIGSAGAVAGLVFWTKAWQVQHVSCQLYNEPCPEVLTSALSQSLLGQPLFFTQPSIPEDYRLVSHATILPSELVLEIAPTQVLGSSTNSQVIITPELAVEHTRQLLEKENISNQNIVLSSDQQTIIVTINPELRALLFVSDLDANVEKLSLILTYLDLPTIDADIREIDVRYRLPVLRTKLSDID